MWVKENVSGRGPEKLYLVISYSLFGWLCECQFFLEAILQLSQPGLGVLAVETQSSLYFFNESDCWNVFSVLDYFSGAYCRDQRSANSCESSLAHHFFCK